MIAECPVCNQYIGCSHCPIILSPPICPQVQCSSEVSSSAEKEDSSTGRSQSSSPGRSVSDMSSPFLEPPPMQKFRDQKLRKSMFGRRLLGSLGLSSNWVVAPSSGTASETGTPSGSSPPEVMVSLPSPYYDLDFQDWFDK